MKSLKLMGFFAACTLALAGCAGSPPAPPGPTAGGPNAPLPTLPGSGGEPEGGEATEVAPASEPIESAGPFAGLNFRDGWARIPFSATTFGGYGTDQMNDVVAGGPGVVAVGFSIRSSDIDAVVWYSVDAVFWSRVEGSLDLGGPGVQTINAVAAGPAGLVAVGMEQNAEGIDAAVWFSADGFEWVRVQDADGVFGDANSQVMNDVSAFGDGFVAVGIEKTETEVRAAVWTSTNGTIWQRSAHTEEVFGGSTRYASLENVLASGDSLFASGTVQPVDDLDVDAAVWFSEDAGETWRQIEDPETSLGDAGVVRFQLVSGIARGSTGFMMVATEQNPAGSPSGEYTNGLIWSSPDGISWTRVYDHKPDLAQQMMLDVISSGFGFFIGGNNVLGDQSQAVIWHSEDGVTWSEVPHSEIVFGGSGLQRINALAEAGPGVVAVGTTTENGDQDAAVWIFVPGR